MSFRLGELELATGRSAETPKDDEGWRWKESWAEAGLEGKGGGLLAPRGRVGSAIADARVALTAK